MSKGKHQHLPPNNTFYTALPLKVACADLESPRELYEGNGFSKWRIIEQDDSHAVFYAVMMVRTRWSDKSASLVYLYAVMHAVSENVTKVELKIGPTWYFWLTAFGLVCAVLYIFWTLSKGSSVLGIGFLVFLGIIIKDFVMSVLEGRITLYKHLIGILEQEDKYQYFEREAIS